MCSLACSIWYSPNNKRIISTLIKTTHTDRRLKYCFNKPLLCTALTDASDSCLFTVQLPELIYWHRHLGSQWVIYPDANSSGWPISELWLSRTSVDKAWDDFCGNSCCTDVCVCECLRADCISSWRSFCKHFFIMFCSGCSFLIPKGIKDGGLDLLKPV